jgi:hypothetical protein
MSDVSVIDPRLLRVRRPAAPPAGAGMQREDEDGAPHVAPLFASRLIPLSAALALSLALWAGIFKLGALLF